MSLQIIPPIMTVKLDIIVPLQSITMSIPIVLLIPFKLCQWQKKYVKLLNSSTSQQLQIIFQSPQPILSLLIIISQYSSQCLDEDSKLIRKSTRGKLTIINADNLVSNASTNLLELRGNCYLMPTVCSFHITYKELIDYKSNSVHLATSCYSLPGFS